MKILELESIKRKAAAKDLLKWDPHVITIKAAIQIKISPKGVFPTKLNCQM